MQQAVTALLSNAQPEHGGGDTTVTAQPHNTAEATNTAAVDTFGDAPPGVDPAFWSSLDAETAAAIQAAMFQEDLDVMPATEDMEGSQDEDDGAHD